MDTNDEEILELVEENPESSTRVISAQLYVGHMMVLRRLKGQQLHPYHLTVQELLDEYYPKRMGFYDWFLTENNPSINLSNHILYTDKDLQ